MGWLKDAWNAGVGGIVQNVIDATVKITTGPTKAVIDVFGGKDPIVAAKEAFAGQIGAGADAMSAVANLDAMVQDVEQRVATKVLGKNAGNIVADINRIMRPLDPNMAVAAANAVEQFILTGKIELLNPIAIALAGEIQRCRNVMYKKARRVPADVKAAMPAAIRPLIDAVRVVDSSEMPGNLNLPDFALDHLKRATAITLIDVIVFKDIPSARTDNTKHLWCHEFHHVRQYAEKGLEKFCAEYIAEELSGFEPYNSPPGNALEIEADYFACRYFPKATPSYIDRCPVILVDEKKRHIVRRQKKDGTEQATVRSPAKR